MKFFGISQHISGPADIRGILAEIGEAHTLDDLTLSAHHWVMGREKDSIPMLDGETWRQTILRWEWDRFHAEWRDRLDAYDAFICFYPAVFAYLYQYFDKPIICQFATRYEHPFERDPERWSEFNTFLRDGADSGKIILCANNPYDAAYAGLFLQRPVPFVPSLCEYTAAQWRPGDSSDRIVYYAPRRIAELEEHSFTHKSTALPPGHSWQDVARARAIAHFPYNVSTMSIIEQYTMGVPILFPTREYALSLYAAGARLFGQNSWVATFGGPAGSVIEPPGGFPGRHDPNDFISVDSLRHWLQYADYYDSSSMQGLTYFSSLEELIAIGSESPAFFEDVSARMRRFYPARRDLAVNGWRRIIEAIS